MRKFGQRVVLVHELGQLGGTKEFLDGCHDRTDIDECLRRDDIHILNGHALAYYTFHTGQTDAELILQEFTYSAHAAVAQMVDIVRAAYTIHEVQQIVNGSDDIVLRNRAVMDIKRRRAQQFHAAAIFLQQIELYDFAFAKELAFTLNVNGIEHIFRNHFALRNDDFARFLIHDGFSQYLAQNTALPAELLGQLVTANRSQVVTLRVKEQRIQKLLGIVFIGRFARTQTAVNFDYSLALGLHILAIAFQRVHDAGIFTKEVNDFFISSKTKGANEVSHRHLTRAVDTYRHHIIGIRFEFNPRTTVRNNRSIIKMLTRWVNFLSIICTWRTNQLADDNALCTVDDKRTGIRHKREIAHEHFLFFNFACLTVDKTDIYADRSRKRHITLFALVELILRLA